MLGGHEPLEERGAWPLGLLSSREPGASTLMA
jgi:hypothetical protein